MLISGWCTSAEGQDGEQMEMALASPKAALLFLWQDDSKVVAPGSACTATVELAMGTHHEKYSGFPSPFFPCYFCTFVICSCKSPLAGQL
jgi:hypothetical protein